MIGQDGLALQILTDTFLLIFVHCGPFNKEPQKSMAISGGLSGGWPNCRAQNPGMSALNWVSAVCPSETLSNRTHCTCRDIGMLRAYQIN
jgi:hypothetical protein